MFDVDSMHVNPSAAFQRQRCEAQKPQRWYEKERWQRCSVESSNRCRTANSSTCKSTESCREALSKDPYSGVRVGQAKNPGPEHANMSTRQDTTKGKSGTKTDSSKGYKFQIANVTNLLTNGYLLAKRTCNALIVSEHSIKQFQIPKAKGILGGACKISLSELDPEASCNLGGVGIISFDQ